MNRRASAHRLQLFVTGVLLLITLLPGCQSGAPAPMAPATLVVLPPTVVLAAQATFPATWTPQPDTAKLAITPSTTPTATATINVPQTLAAQTSEAKSMVCSRYPDAWQVTVKPSGTTGICQLNSSYGSLYEYQMRYPAEWKVNTFGGDFPSLLFVTGLKDVEMRLYQVFSIGAKNFAGPIEDAPAKALFCERSATCNPIIETAEKPVGQLNRVIGLKPTIIHDTQGQTRFIRRYFFYVDFYAAKPKGKRLFMIKIYTPTAIADGKDYPGLLTGVENMISTLQYENTKP